MHAHELALAASLSLPPSSYELRSTSYYFVTRRCHEYDATEIRYARHTAAASDQRRHRPRTIRHPLGRPSVVDSLRWAQDT